MDDNSEDILKNLEDISGNLEYLINYLQESGENYKSDVNQDVLDNISNNFSSFNTYLKSIDNNTSITTQKMSAYLDSVNNLDSNVLNDNPEYNQISLSVNDLILKLDELKTSLSLSNSETTINIDTTKIDEIKEQLQSDFLINLDIQNIDSSVNDIIEKLNTISNTPINLNLSPINDEYTNVLNNLNSLKDIKFDNLDFDNIKTEKLDNAISSLNKLSEMSNLNFDDLKTSLENIQNIDLKNLNFDDLKTSLESIQNIDFNKDDITLNIKNLYDEINKFESINLGVNIDFDMSDKIEDIKTELLNVSKDLKNNFNFELSPNIKIDIDDKNIENINNKFKNINISINPDDELLNNIKNELDTAKFDVKINPIIENTPIFETKTEMDFKTIKDEDKYNNNEQIVSYMEKNNKLLEGILNKINTTPPTQPINIVPEKVEPSKNIVSVTPNNIITKNDNSDYYKLVELMQELVSVNKNMLKKLSKNSFNTDLNI